MNESSPDVIGNAPAPHPRWSRRVVVIAGAGGGALLVLAIVGVVFGVLFATASAHYDEALADRKAAVTDLRNATELADETAEKAHTAVDNSAALLDPALAPFLGADTSGILSISEDLVKAIDGQTRASAPRVTAVPVRPGDITGLQNGAQDLRDEAGVFERAADAITRGSAALAKVADNARAEGKSVLDELPHAAAQVDTANLQAANGPRIAFRDAADAVAGWTDHLPGELATYRDAAQALQASQAAEMAEKAGPLLDSRLAAEAFARSLAAGTMLDFDWAPVVYGSGLGGSYGGYTTWNTANGGYATIALSNSVASLWDRVPGVKSLVAHEVGHAITSQCYSLYKGSGAPNEEAWATAWAIGSGFNDDGNGESIYGRPSDALIATSKGCR